MFLFPVESHHIYRGRNLPDNYKPTELTQLSPRVNYLNTIQSVDARIANKLEHLIAESEKDGMCLIVTSSYRTKEYQAKLYAKAQDKSFSAKPRQSEHETGLAVDFGVCPMTNGVRDDTAVRLEAEQEFNTLPEYQWLKEHAFEYGVEESYREDNQKKSGYSPEPWHWKFML